LTSSSIVSEREPELALLCLREEDEVVVTVEVEFEVDDAVASDGTDEDVVILLFVVLLPPPPPRLRDSELALGAAVPSDGII
jgi:hypothetical protein